MKLLFGLTSIILAFTFATVAQEKASPTDTDKNEAIPSTTYLKRGAPIGSAKKVSLAKVMKDPSKYAG
jgi:hypothetical protein